MIWLSDGGNGKGKPEETMAKKPVHKVAGKHPLSRHAYQTRQNVVASSSQR